MNQMTNQMTLENIAKACDGKFFGPESCKKECVQGITIDSRKIETGYLFIPVKGERVDGHDFISQVMEAGAICTLSEMELEDVSYPYVLVSSTLQALKDIAEFYLSVLEVKVIGVTGSVGKTSTKEMIANVLERKFKVLKTAGNFNNEIGLPLTIFQLRPDHEVAVLEMGISEFGEMSRLSKIAKPDICVITNIGVCHLEQLKDREGILKAKSEIFEYMKPGGTVILNGDDDMLATLKEVNGKATIFFGMSEEEDYFADCMESCDLTGSNCKLHGNGQILVTNIPIPGRHMIYNALAAMACGNLLGLTEEEVQQGIESVEAIQGRSHFIEVDGMTIIDDCYNANPTSMKASIEVLSYAYGRKLAILGDMFELGEKEDSLHYEVGTYLGEMGIDALFALGKLSLHLVEGAIDACPECNVHYFDTMEEMLEEVFDYIRQGDTILVKASHGMHFEEVVNQLTRNLVR